MLPRLKTQGQDRDLKTPVQGKDQGLQIWP